jgi:hypothetical protein
MQVRRVARWLSARRLSAVGKNDRGDGTTSDGDRIVEWRWGGLRDGEDMSFFSGGQATR